MNEIQSRKNPLVIHLKKLGADADYRREAGEFLCDGDKLLSEALDNNAEITAVLFSGEKQQALPEHISAFKVPFDIIKTISPLKTPQDVVFSCRIPVCHNSPAVDGFHIILEGIQDPGNVGTVLRTAGAFNVRSVILTGGCADPYNPKTIRASMGAIFRQPITVTDLGGLRALKDAGLKLYGAALSAESRDVREIAFHNTGVAIGSEGRGLTPELLSLCDEKIIIPMAPQCESLNAAVAAAVIMWEAAKGSF